jgi:hypothetical protein
MTKGKLFDAVQRLEYGVRRKYDPALLRWVVRLKPDSI